jgi:hypothetical protein
LMPYARRLDDDMSKSMSGGPVPHAPQPQLQPQQQQIAAREYDTCWSIQVFSVMVILENSKCHDHARSLEWSMNQFVLPGAVHGWWCMLQTTLAYKVYLRRGGILVRNVYIYLSISFSRVYDRCVLDLRIQGIFWFWIVSHHLTSS